jgi:hypothetical protein
VFLCVYCEVALAWKSFNTNATHERCLSTVYLPVYSQGALLRKSFMTNDTLAVLCIFMCAVKLLFSNNPSPQMVYFYGLYPLCNLMCGQVAVLWKSLMTKCYSIFSLLTV